MQTEPPYWLKEAYENVITSLDIGLVSRNIFLSVIVKAVIDAFFNPQGKFLDYGGGYGMLVRMLRDEGYDFYREDKFCDNLFAKHFDMEDLEVLPEFELVTAFELFEHLPEPIPEIEQMLSHGKSILFSTELQPVSNIESWEYVAPETGQHVAFYTHTSLQEIAKRFDLNIYSNHRNVHLLTKKKIKGSVFSMLTRFKLAKLYNRMHPKQRSLLMKDYDMIKKKINMVP
jgi:2-polyprenyl-3-methyl-5-hydroxy-6-metoxy-1,4-benzoquinol methylase